MTDPIYVVEALCVILILLMLGLGLIAAWLLITQQGTRKACEQTTLALQGVVLELRQQNMSLTNLHSEFQRQNKILKKKSGIVTSGNLSTDDPDTTGKIPVYSPGGNQPVLSERPIKPIDSSRAGNTVGNIV